MRVFRGAKAGSSQRSISISLSGTVCTSVSAYCWHCGLILQHCHSHPRCSRLWHAALLCEQVVGRALRRQSYDLNEEGLFNVEYADVLGIPFDFTAKPVVAPPQPPRQTVVVKAMPERAALEIRFPRVVGY